jgi:hypothetical protein
MWELQPLSTNRRTTEISLLLGENTSLTISQIPHNFVGLLSFTLSSCSLVSLFWCDIYGKDALPIYRQASLPLSCKRQEQGKWHQLVLQVAPNWCPFCWLSCTNWCQLASHSPTWRLWWFNQVFTLDHLWFFYPFYTCHLYAAYVSAKP